MFSDLYRLCNEKRYFTCGSSLQYQRMFDMAEQGATAHDVALVIWICSENADLNVIEKEVENIFKVHIKKSLPSGVIE